MKLPMTPPQLRLWRLEREEGRDLPQYTMEREGELDPRFWGSARSLMKAFVARHEVLRTSVVLLPDGPWLQVDDPDRAHAYISARISEAEPETEAEKGRNPTTALPERLTRVTYEERGGRARVTITLHHILMDSWGWRLLCEDFDAFSTGAPTQLLRQPSEYAQPSAGERYERNLLAERARFRREFVLEESSTARSGPHEGSLFHDGSFALIKIPGSVFATLRRSRAVYRVTDFSIWHAAIAARTDIGIEPRCTGMWSPMAMTSPALSKTAHE